VAIVFGGLQVSLNPFCSLDALDPQLIEATNHAGDRLLASWLVDNQFANHRIVERRNGVASVNVRIEPDVKNGVRLN